MQFHEVFKRSNFIDHQVRLILDYFGYLEGKLEHIVNLRCPVIYSGYLKDKLESLPIKKLCVTCNSMIGKFISRKNNF